MSDRAEKAVEPDEILPPAKRGRPRIEVDLDLLEKLAALQCTDYEIAHVVGISLRTFASRKVEDPDFAAALNYGRNMGVVSLRKWQFDAAKRGNAAMLTRLGEEYLGQRVTEEEPGEASFSLEIVTTGDVDDGAAEPEIESDDA